MFRVALNRLQHDRQPLPHKTRRRADYRPIAPAVRNELTDYLVRIIAKEAGIRAMACLTTDLVREGTRRHATRGVATVALSDALTGAALVGALLKIQQRVAIKFTGDGALTKLIVEADSYGRVRGYVAAQMGEESAEYSPLAPASPFGTGQLTVVKDVLLKDLIESVVPLTGGAIDEDIAVYLNLSEQVPSLVEIGTVVEADGEDSAESIVIAGGLLLQVMPNGDRALLDRLAERIEELPPVAELLHSGQTPEAILALVFDGVPYQEIEQRALTFQCSCSRERSAKALVSLGRDELEHLLIHEGRAVIDCHFCHERYIFEEPELIELLHRLP